jgi:hypothetical protein
MRWWFYRRREDVKALFLLLGGVAVLIYAVRWAPAWSRLPLAFVVGCVGMYQYMERERKKKRPSSP